jgi:hypothetical protein
VANKRNTGLTEFVRREAFESTEAEVLSRPDPAAVRLLGRLAFEKDYLGKGTPHPSAPDETREQRTICPILGSLTNSRTLFARGQGRVGDEGHWVH